MRPTCSHLLSWQTTLDLQHAFREEERGEGGGGDSYFISDAIYVFYLRLKLGWFGSVLGSTM